MKFKPQFVRKRTNKFYILKENTKQTIFILNHKFSLQLPEDKHIKACYLLGFRACQHFEAAINIWNILTKQILMAFWSCINWFW